MREQTRDSEAQRETNNNWKGQKKKADPAESCSPRLHYGCWLRWVLGGGGAGLTCLSLKLVPF